jgi:hypothetical protein
MGFPAIAVKLLKSQSVGTTSTAIPHGLPSSMFGSSGIRIWGIIVTGANAYVAQSAVPDATNVYLIANVATTVDVIVGPDDVGG